MVFRLFTDGFPNDKVLFKKSLPFFKDKITAERKSFFRTICTPSNKSLFRKFGNSDKTPFVFCAYILHNIHT